VLTSLKHTILRINKIHGVEASFSADGNLTFHTVTLRLERNTIIKEKEWRQIDSLEDLSNQLPGEIPVALVVNGKGVLHKKLQEQPSQAKILEAVLPSADPAEFYIDSIHYAGMTSCSIIRKNILDNLLIELGKKGFKIVSVSVGASSIQNLLPYLHFKYDPVLESNSFLFRLADKNELVEIRALPAEGKERQDKKEYKIGDQYIFSTGLLPFAAALSTLGRKGLNIDNGVTNPHTEKILVEYKYYKYLKFSLWTFLISIFTILLVNFFIYNHLFNRNLQRQTFKVALEEESLAKSKLHASMVVKENFIRQYGWARPSRLSLYADRIAGLVPVDAQLTGIKLYPVNNAGFGNDGNINIKKDTIQVTGICDDPTELNRFTNNLRNINDFKKVVIQSYLYKKEVQNGVFQLEIITN
jgi:hypothetical protein